MWLLSPWCSSRLDRPHCLSLRQNHLCIIIFIIMILRNPGSCPDLPTLKLVQIVARGFLLLWSYKAYSLLMPQCSTLFESESQKQSQHFGSSTSKTNCRQTSWCLRVCSREECAFLFSSTLWGPEETLHDGNMLTYASEHVWLQEVLCRYM